MKIVMLDLVTNQGTLAVVFGVVLFAMGYWKGKRSYPHDLVVSTVLEQLIDGGFIKTKKVLVDGKWETEILTVDQEE
jgi:hypothetical protein